MATRTQISEIQAGDEFKVVRGSRAGSLGVTGSVLVDTLDDPRGSIAISVGKFGFRINVQLKLKRTGDDVEIIASGSAFDTITIHGRVAQNEPNEIRLEDVAGELADTHLVLADDGSATLDAEIPSVGIIQLLLEPA